MFPPVDLADDDGLLAIGGDLKIDTLLLAYRSGIFPWPVEGYPTLWFAPPQRTVLFFDEFHISKSLRKQMRQTQYEVRIDSCFEQVIRACAAPRVYEAETWILPEMIAAYEQFHRAGYAHSVEVFANNELVGGLYGVAMGKYFAGESMFHHATGASKIALVYLVEHLQKQGATWLDVQMPTPLFESFGARCIPRDEFMSMLQKAQSELGTLFG